MKYLLLDLNGTIHVGDTPTPGALVALEKLQKESHGGQRFKVRFCSNSSKESSSSLISRLRAMSFPASLIPSEDVFTSLDAARRLFPSSSLGSSPLLLLSPSAQETFKDLPGAFHARPDRLPAELTEEEHKKLRGCDAVVLGLAPGLMRYEWLDEAFRLLSGEYGSKKVSLVGTHRVPYLRPGSKTQADGSEKKQPLSLGPGGFLAALEEAAGLKREETITVGKPQWAFFEECLKEMGWDPEGVRADSNGPEDEMWIVGDDAVQDLSILTPAATTLPSNIIIKRALVQTGKYRSGDEDKVASLSGRAGEQGPDEISENFEDWVQRFLNSRL